MSRNIVSPAAIDFDSPGRRDYWVALEHGTIWGAHLIPLTVIVGPKTQPGKGLVAIGSTHGNEYEGPVAIKNVLAEVKTADVLGRLVFIPVLNVEAFRTGTRDTAGADVGNLNRAFVDGAGEESNMLGITYRLAKFIRDAIWPQVHIVLDLHSGGQVMRFSQCSSFHPIDNPELAADTLEAAKWFGVPLIMVYQNRTPGLLTSEAERLGKITVGTELGWGEAVLGSGVAYARQGILAAAIRHGLLRGEIKPFAHHADGTQKRGAIVAAECYTAAPFDGHFEEIVRCGSDVKKGELLGRLHDFQRIDEPALPLLAPHNGVLVGTSWGARVRQGQFVTCVGIREE